MSFEEHLWAGLYLLGFIEEPAYVRAYKQRRHMLMLLHDLYSLRLHARNRMEVSHER